MLQLTGEVRVTLKPLISKVPIVASANVCFLARPVTIPACYSPLLKLIFTYLLSVLSGCKSFYCRLLPGKWGKWRERADLVKVKVRTLDIAPLRSESPPQKRSGMARVLEGFHSFTCTPTRSSAIGMSHTCLCLPGYNWYSFTDPGRMEG